MGDIAENDLGEPFSFSNVYFDLNKQFLLKPGHIQPFLASLSANAGILPQLPLHVTLSTIIVPSCPSSDKPLLDTLSKHAFAESPNYVLFTCPLINNVLPPL
jgi:hypothetical protein